MQLVIRAYILFLALNVFVLVTNNLSDDEDVRHENREKTEYNQYMHVYKWTSKNVQEVCSVAEEPDSSRFSSNSESV